MARYASEWHEPIMVEEVLEYLRVSPGGRYIDGTLGGGGHTHAILDACSPDGRVLAIDRDPTAIEFARERLAPFGDRVCFARGNYGDVVRIAAENDFLPADGFLVDAGVSSRQLDEADRGFSFRQAGPLDMRMGRDEPPLGDYLDAVEDEDGYRWVPPPTRAARGRFRTVAWLVAAAVTWSSLRELEDGGRAVVVPGSFAQLG